MPLKRLFWSLNAVKTTLIRQPWRRHAQGFNEARFMQEFAAQVETAKAAHHAYLKRVASAVTLPGLGEFAIVGIVPCSGIQRRLSCRAQHTSFFVDGRLSRALLLKAFSR